jgi:hypothetical protein
VFLSTPTPQSTPRQNIPPQSAKEIKTNHTKIEYGSGDDEEGEGVELVLDYLRDHAC